MKTIILVAAHNYQDPSIANVFTQSLKNTGYTGQIGLFTDHLRLDYPDTVYADWSSDTTYFRSSKRLFHYLNFLKQSPIQYDQVITSGIRDVLFQRNPQTMPFKRVNLYREPETKMLGECPYNSKWLINSGYITPELAKKPIICAEIITGSHDGMIQLLTDMCEEAERNPRKHDLEDQAILNYMYWNHKLDYAECWENDYSPVYTVGYEPYIRVAFGGGIINRHGDIPHIVHQYDRFLNVS